MKYPSFLKEKSVIGITAPSSGVGYKVEEFDLSVEKIKNRGYSIVETKSVRNEGDTSNTSQKRAEELMDLFARDDISCIICATGGDFLTDILPFVDYSIISSHPKWIMGASDPTNLLYTITTFLDIATLYGHNAASFDSSELHLSQRMALDFLEGKLSLQESYPYYEKNRDSRVDGNYSLMEESRWISNQDKVDVTGRIIGGCLDCLRYLSGTSYDHTKEFIEKYRDDGIIWYFDVFSMSAEDFYLSLFQLKEAGWFSYVKGVVMGRILYPSGNTTMTYEKALYKIFGSIPIIMDADIGHVVPKMTIINGSIVRIMYEDYKGSIEQFLK